MKMSKGGNIKGGQYSDRHGKGLKCNNFNASGKGGKPLKDTHLHKSRKRLTK